MGFDVAEVDCPRCEELIEIEDEVCPWCGYNLLEQGGVEGISFDESFL